MALGLLKGTNLAATPFRGASQQHFVHVTTTFDDLGVGTTAPVAVTAAVWLVQAVGEVAGGACDQGIGIAMSRTVTTSLPRRKIAV